MTTRNQNARPPVGNELWDKYFRVRMAYLHSRNVDHLRKFGQRISGIEEIDRNIDKQMIDTEMTIDGMFEKWRSGVTIRVVRYEDTAEIYRIIHAHLIAWAEYMSTGINIGNAPLKDLIELDKFAELVYDKAKSVFAKEERETAIASNFLNVQSINFRNILKRELNSTEVKTNASGVEVVRVKPREDSGIRERQGLGQLFSEQVNQLAKWRE